MLVSSYTSRKTDLTLTCCLPALLLLFFGCKTQTIWDIPVHEVTSRLAASDYRFLEDNDLSGNWEKEALRIGPEAPYFLSFIFDELGQPDRAEALLRLQVKNKKSPWKWEALQELLNRLNGEERYIETEETALEHLQKDVPPSVRYEIYRALIEAFYWQKKDKEVLGYLDIFEDSTEEWPESLLFRAVSLDRLGNPSSQDSFERLFIELPVSDLHIRAFGYLQLDENRWQKLQPPVSQIIEGKYRLAMGQSERGIEILENALPQIDSEKLDRSALIKDLGFAYSATQQSRGAVFLEKLSADLSGQAKLDAQEMSGRLYRRIRNTSAADRMLRMAMTTTADNLQRDRCAWYIIRMNLDLSEKRAIDEIIQSVGTWSDPEYFDDVLSELLARLVYQGAGDTLRRLYVILAGKASSFIMSRLGFIVSHPKVSPVDPQLRISGENRYTVKELYYRFLILTIDPAKSIPLIGAEISVPDIPMGHQESLVSGFLRFGLHKRGYETAVRYYRTLPTESLYRTARILSAKENYKHSMRLMDLYFRRSDCVPTREKWEVAYPLAFGRKISDLSEQYNLPPYLFNALVREESYFDPDIESSAGAVGLTQLMAETAREIAGELKLEDPDLTDPEVNLSIGGRYLAKLLRLSENAAMALMYYNAGLTRVRRWVREGPENPEELLTEAFPIEETRHFVRKVLVSTVLYRYLYSGDEPSRSVRLFFPSLPVSP